MTIPRAPKISGGYTIIEVMLVLAISATLLAAALAIFGNQATENRYFNTVQDASSKILNFGTQIGSGVYPDSDRYSCALEGGGTPILSSIASNPDSLGGRSPCDFLGRAFQIVPDTGTLYVYTVLGNKNTLYNGKPVAQSTSSTLIEASNPRIAQLSNSTIALADTYTLAGGARFVSSYVTIQGVQTKGWELATVYNSLGGITPSSGTSALQVWGYPLFKASSTAPVSNQVPQGADDCIRYKCGNAGVADEWDLCIQNAENNHPFLITVRGTASGIATKTIDNGCDGVVY